MKEKQVRKKPRLSLLLDREHLGRYIKRRGIPKSKILVETGICYTSLFSKLNGSRPFREDELAAMFRVLRPTDAELLELVADWRTAPETIAAVALV